MCHQHGAEAGASGHWFGRGFGWTLLLQRPGTDRTYEGRRVATRSILQTVPPVCVVMAWRRDRPLGRAARALVEHSRTLVPQQEAERARSQPSRR